MKSFGSFIGILLSVTVAFSVAAVRKQASADRSGVQIPSKLAFEAATLKETPPNYPLGIGYFMTYAGGRMTLSGCTLSYLIQRAYKAQAHEILNAPAWVSQVPYSIEAVPPSSPPLANYTSLDPKSGPPDEELAMLQNLIVERFHLKVHEEMKDEPGFALVRGDRQLRLDEPADKTHRPLVTFNTPDTPGGTFFRQAFNISMKDLATSLSRDLKAPVLDQTGIPGSYDFKFEFMEDRTDPTPGGYLFDAIQQIGLKLKPIKAPARNIVVDHVEKPTLD